MLRGLSTHTKSIITSTTKIFQDQLVPHCKDKGKKEVQRNRTIDNTNNNKITFQIKSFMKLKAKSNKNKRNKEN